MALARVHPRVSNRVRQSAERRRLAGSGDRNGVFESFMTVVG